MKKYDRGFLLTSCILLSLCMATGCGKTEEGLEEYLILEKEPEEEELDYSLVSVTTEDIKIVQEIECIYQQADDEELSFKISGKRVKNVHVQEGEKVKKGQVLAELEMGNIDERMAEVQYELERAQILLKHTQEDMDFTIERMEMTKDESSMTDEDKKSYAENLASVRQNYEYQLEDYQDKIAVLSQRMADIQKEKNSQYIYAGMSGTVAYVKENLEGTSSIAGEKVMTVMDIGECTFCTSGIEYKDYFEEEKPVEIQITGRSDSCLVVPYKKSSWKEIMQFTLYDETENQNLSVGALGTIELVIDEHKQVLTLPKNAVHTADGKSYVYVVGENNIWEVKWITIGLEGKQKVEITDGLSEGDMVILK